MTFAVPTLTQKCRQVNLKDSFTGRQASRQTVKDTFQGNLTYSPLHIVQKYLSIHFFREVWIIHNELCTSHGVMFSKLD